MSKISLGQLDLLALQQYLEIVVGFRKKDDKALDVTNVGTYMHPTIDDTDDASETEISPVLANQVAMAALDEYGLPIAVTDGDGVIIIPERQTVVNALKLGGVDAADFLKKVESDAILTDVNNATYNMSDDIRNLKDELYQLKNQLIKSGSIKDPNVYNGYIDAFIESKNTHTDNTGVRVEMISGNTAYVESVANLRIGDIVVFENNGEFNIQKIMTIGYNEFDVDLEWEGSSGPLAAHQGSFVRKSLGISKNGKFVFGCKPENGRVATRDLQFIVKDGIERVKVFELDHAGHGYGTEIKIPASLQDNVITKIEVSLAIKGNPGEIQGVFWKYDEDMLSYVETDYRTRGISPLEASGWFNNFVADMVTEMPVQPGERYILIMECTSGSDEDKWFIGGFNDDECADDVHNDSYIQSNNLLYKSVEDKDMFLILNTKKMAESEIKRLPYGLYTCDFDVRRSLANRIRVELCINQEGLFKVADNLATNLATGRVSEIPLDVKGNTIFREDIFKTGDAFVIGNEIGEISSVGFNNNNVIPRQDMYIKRSADVYRVGYEIQAIVSNKVMDPTVTGVVERYENAEIYPLKLVGVVPGRDIIRPDQSSDRLLFEAEFYDQDDPNNIKLMSFDHIQLQIRWYSNVDSNTLQANDALEGAIFDVTVSVDQAYTTNPNNR
jgi:hypothetical protein